MQKKIEGRPSIAVLREARNAMRVSLENMTENIQSAREQIEELVADQARLREVIDDADRAIEQLEALK